MSILTRTSVVAATVALVAGASVTVVEGASSASPRTKAPLAATVTEGGDATLTVRLKRPARKKTEMTWRTRNGSAVGGLDFTAMGNGRVVFHKGYRKATLQVSTLQDLAVEGREHFFVRFKGRKHAAELRHARLKVVIIDDDKAGSSASGSTPPSASAHPGPPPSL